MTYVPKCWYESVSGCSPASRINCYVFDVMRSVHHSSVVGKIHHTHAPIYIPSTQPPNHTYVQCGEHPVDTVLLPLEAEEVVAEVHRGGRRERDHLAQYLVCVNWWGGGGKGCTYVVRWI